MNKKGIKQLVRNVVNDYINGNCINTEAETINELPTYAVMFSIAVNGNEYQTRTIFGLPAESEFSAQVAVISLYDNMAQSLGIDDMDIKILSVEREYLDS